MSVDVVEFSKSDVSAIVDRIAGLAGSGQGEGWINIGPALTDDEFASLPQPSGLGQWFSGRGPVVPMATWTPGSTDGRGRAAQVGIAHGTGPNALSRLAAHGLDLPEGWRKRQDHAKHGIVADLPPDLRGEDMIAWLLAAMTALSPRVAIGDSWIAEVHRPA